MKIIRFLFVSIITIALTVALNIKVSDNIPPLGSFFEPFGGFWQNAIDDTKLIEKEITLNELTDNVKIHYDDNLIPHIIAQNEKDLFFAQGFITAQHRLWQMEMQTMLAAGKLSEVFGASLLEVDRLSRRKGLTYGARNALKALKQDEELYNLLLNYSNGVNAYIETLGKGDLPLEYKMLDYEPEAWSPYKSMLLLKYMADMLSGYETDLENTNLVKVFGKETFDLLFPDRNFGDNPIIPVGHEWEFDPLPVPEADADYPAELITEVYTKPDRNNGSNNWVLGPSKTSAGKALLANDMHLSLNLPSIWFLMHLTSPEINVYGASIPGAMGIIAGCNDSIAWGMTNAKRDVIDWYKITYRDEEKLEYKYGNNWLKTQKVVEKFDIRAEEPYYDTVIYTHYGPVVYDQNFMSSSDMENYAMKWTAHQPSLEQKTFYLLNKGSSYDDFTNAIQHFSCPAQNLVFASTNNDIAIHVQGKFPIKWPQQGKFLLDGSDPLHEWYNYIPFEHNPKSHNPESGHLSSANQYPVDSLYPYYVYDAYYEDFRNRRIHEQLEGIQSASVRDMMNLQMDVFNKKAELSLPKMLSKLDTNALSGERLQVYQLLKNWDYLSSVNQAAPAYYEIWWNKFYQLLWDEFKIDTIAIRSPEAINTIKFLDRDDFEFADVQNTPQKENLSEVIRQSFIQALDSANQWKDKTGQEITWGNMKTTSIMHLLRIPALSIMDAGVGGYKNIVNANSERHGASIRIITEMGNPVEAWMIYPGGQSGTPGSRYYDNLVEKWAGGEYINVNLSRDVTQDKILLTQQLNP